MKTQGLERSDNTKRDRIIQPGGCIKVNTSINVPKFIHFALVKEMLALSNEIVSPVALPFLES